MNRDEFDNYLDSINDDFNEKKSLYVIDEKFNEAKELFTKIYDEFVNSNGFKEVDKKIKQIEEEYMEAKKRWEETETYKNDPNVFKNKCRLGILSDEYKKVKDKYPDHEEIYEKYKSQLLKSDVYFEEFIHYSKEGLLDRQRYEMKIKLLKRYLKIDSFPDDWYYVKGCWK
jgi:hypothetical protein